MKSTLIVLFTMTMIGTVQADQTKLDVMTGQQSIHDYIFSDFFTSITHPVQAHSDPFSADQETGFFASQKHGSKTVKTTSKKKWWVSIGKYESKNKRGKAQYFELDPKGVDLSQYKFIKITLRGTYGRHIAVQLLNSVKKADANSSVGILKMQDVLTYNEKQKPITSMKGEYYSYYENGLTGDIETIKVPLESVWNIKPSLEWYLSKTKRIVVHYGVDLFPGQYVDGAVPGYYGNILNRKIAGKVSLISWEPSKD